MAKVKLDYMSLSMRAEGSDDMVRELSGRFLDMADKYAAPGFYFPALPPSVFEDGCRDPEELNTGDMKPLTTPKEVAPGADWDVVAIYDDAGIPSIMHRFRRMSNKELFGGSDKPHPAFIIGGEVYDEIYISVYPNVMINGKPYSLPFQKPAENITLDDFSKACFSKGLCRTGTPTTAHGMATIRSTARKHRTAIGRSPELARKRGRTITPKPVSTICAAISGKCWPVCGLKTVC